MAVPPGRRSAESPNLARPSRPALQALARRQRRRIPLLLNLPPPVFLPYFFRPWYVAAVMKYAPLV